MLLRAILVASLAGLLAACGEPLPPFDPVADGTSHQAVRVEPKSGTPYVVSKEAHSIVAVTPVRESAFSGYGLTFDLELVALSEPIKGFDSSSVLVRQNGKMLDVLDRDGLQERIRADNQRQQNMLLVMGMMGAMSSGMAAANPTAMSASTISMNSASLSVASMTTDQLVSNNNALGKQVQRTHLSTISVPAGGTDGALISIPDAEGEPLMLHVNVGSDWHYITFAPRK